MSDQTEELRLIRTARGAVELWDTGEQRVIKTSARVGAWGVGTGGALLLLGLLGVHLPLGWLVGGVGLIGGGLASVTASAAVLRKVWKGPFRHLKVAGVLGIPFGLSAVVAGGAILTRDVAVAFATGWAVVLLVILGIGLTAVFGSGTLKHFWQLLGVEVEEPE